MGLFDNELSGRQAPVNRKPRQGGLFNDLFENEEKQPGRQDKLRKNLEENKRLQEESKKKGGLFGMAKETGRQLFRKNTETRQQVKRFVKEKVAPAALTDTAPGRIATRLSGLERQGYQARQQAAETEALARRAARKAKTPEGRQRILQSADESKKVTEAVLDDAKNLHGRKLAKSTDSTKALVADVATTAVDVGGLVFGGTIYRAAGTVLARKGLSKIAFSAAPRFIEGSVTGYGYGYADAIGRGEDEKTAHKQAAVTSLFAGVLSVTAPHLLDALAKSPKDGLVQIKNIPREIFKELKETPELWKSLRSIGTNPNTINDIARSRSVMAQYGDLTDKTTKKELRDMYLQGAHRTHPDMGGDHDAFAELNKAYNTMEKYYGNRNYRRAFKQDITDLPPEARRPVAGELEAEIPTERPLPRPSEATTPPPPAVAQQSAPVPKAVAPEPVGEGLPAAPVAKAAVPEKPVPAPKAAPAVAAAKPEVKKPAVPNPVKKTDSIQKPEADKFLNFPGEGKDLSAAIKKDLVAAASGENKPKDYNVSGIYQRRTKDTLAQFEGVGPGEKKRLVTDDEVLVLRERFKQGDFEVKQRGNKNVADFGNEVTAEIVPFSEGAKKATEKTKQTAPVIGRKDMQTIFKNNEEFAKNPVMVVKEIDGKKQLTYEGEKLKFSIPGEALDLDLSKEKVGARIGLGKTVIAPPSQLKREARKVGKEAGLTEDFFLARDAVNDSKTTKITAAGSPEDFNKRIDQLNKFAQSQAILRRTGRLSGPKAAGQFVHTRFNKAGHPLKNATGVAKEGEVRLRATYISDERQYLGVLAHELGHSIEYHLTGATNQKTFDVFGSLDGATRKLVHDELRAVTDALEGPGMSKKPYYSKQTELLARFFEMYITNRDTLSSLAPKAINLIDEQSIRHPILREFLEAAEGSIDKGQPKRAFLPDMRQIYQKYLGKRVGGLAYGEEVAHRAMQERAKIAMEKFIKNKFKDVKDDPVQLFRTAEAIKVTREGKPVFGTRRLQVAKDDKEAGLLQMQGWEFVEHVVQDGEARPMFGIARYTPEQGKQFYDSLSPKGKELINDFTAARDEAKDLFNREVIKDTYKIEGNIEGWVHHFFDPDFKLSDVTVARGNKFKFKEAGTRKKRGEKEGYIEDLQLAMQKVLTGLESEKAYNDFVQRQFARVTKPIPEGAKVDAGWVEVAGNLKRGVPADKMVVIKDGKKFVPQQARYQMPGAIYERYKKIDGLVEEATTAVKVVNSLNRYWRVNVLSHLGSASTNAISGGIQYSSKVLTDFYTEALTGSVKFEKTRKDVGALLKIVMPKGWNDAPDWIYGADLSNYYGQFTKQPGVFDKSIDAYANKTLKVFGTVERYWKKAIVTAEKGQHLAGLEEVTKDGLRTLTREERDMIAAINKEVDLFGYDYDNIPVWLEAHNKSVLGQSIKPFATYPYKYVKHITGLAGAAFDRSLPWQERAAKLMTLTTIAGTFAGAKALRDSQRKTPDANEETPARLSPRGSFFAGTDKEGKELFIRVAKYPFLNLTSTGMALVNGEWEEAKDSLSEIVGTIGPVGEAGLLALDYKSKYDQYKPVPVMIGDTIGSFIPLFRNLQDVARMLEPYQKKQRTFGQALGKNIPVTGEDLQNKLHGEDRTVKVPIEGEVKRQKGEGTKRTTTDRTLRNYWQDILLSMLSGVYIKRIDPEDAAAFQIREEKNREEREKKEKKEEKKKAKATD